MKNEFNIGDKVIRKLTESQHVILDISYNPELEVMDPMTGEFKKADSPWNYKIDGFDVWFVQSALMHKPDDWFDPNAATDERDLLKIDYTELTE